jgi:hypothetical protein
MPTNAELKGIVQEEIRDKTEPQSILKSDVANAIDAGYDYTDQEVLKVGKGYKSFVALISHSAGNSNPTAIVLKNEIGNIAFSYQEANSYVAQSSSLFTLNKTVIFATSANSPLLKIGCRSTNASFITIQTDNDSFTNVNLEIRVYD